jgi:uncharacterized protein YbcV (DUF1398 family)
MHQEAVAVMHECARLSDAGKITFPEVIRKLTRVGVERYHTDLCVQEHVYYMPNGETHVEAMDLPNWPIAKDFNEAWMKLAVQAVQSGEIQYLEFLRRIMLAGCVGYFVLLEGHLVQYFGRKGEIHTESIAVAPPAH